MPIKSKKDKRKKKKGRLTNEDILKLIKKLKPKNQQTVRINIGDKGEKKGGASNQPPVRSEVSYFRAPPQTDFFQPPQPPFLINRPAPSLAETQATFTAPAKVAEPEVIVPRRSKERRLKRLELIPEEYEYFTQEPAEKTFNAPEKFRKSILSASSVVPTRFYEPVENDRFQPALIPTTQAQDQIGNRSSFNMSSDSWTLTPSGDVQSVEELQQAKQAEPTLELMPTEEELIQQQVDLLPQAPAQTQTKEEIEAEAEALFASAEKEATRQEKFKKVFNPYESSSESDVLSTTLAPNMTIDEVNRLIREGQITMDEFGLSGKAIYQTGKKQGQLRKEITTRELYPILQAIDKRGLELKKTVPKLTPLQKGSSA
jgi:hypothetical protein